VSSVDRGMGGPNHESPGQGATSRRVRHTALRIVTYALLVLASVATLLPLLWSVAASFSPLADVYKFTVPFSFHAFFPETFTLEAYSELLRGPFARSLLNTMFVCATTIVGGLILNSMAGFAFAVFDFPGKQPLFLLVLITFMVPFEVLALPLYLLTHGVHLDNTFGALIVPALANGMVVFLFRQFFADTPQELLQAARVDGLSWFGVYRRIVLPISGPALVSGALVLFLSQWQAFFWPLVIANQPRYRMVQVALAAFQGEYVTLWNQLFAGSVFSILAPAVLLLILQRYYIGTIARTGLIG
jgi:multiple sugar transport system permease protein